jgi:catechol 2,3-dioxygenase-like lactoylglutathione lyase family enzyme
MIYAIDHVQLAMPEFNEDAARRFYVDALGFTEVPKPSELAKRGGVWFALGAVKLHLGVDPDFRPARKAHPGLLVHDLAEVIQGLQACGVVAEIDNALEGYLRTYVDDPFGNRIELVQMLA